jgi:hypothetical protein
VTSTRFAERGEKEVYITAGNVSPATASATAAISDFHSSKLPLKIRMRLAQKNVTYEIKVYGQAKEATRNKNACI